VRLVRRSALRFRFAFLACVAIATPAVGQDGPPPASVRVDIVRSEPVVLQRSVTGEIRTLRRSLLASQVEGLITDLPYDEGEAVDRGETVAKLDDTNLRIALRAAEGRLDAAEAVAERRRAQLAFAERELERARTLRQRNTMSEGEFDRFETDSAIARAELAEAEADLLTRRAERDRARDEVNDATTAAPFAGRVVTRSAEVGEWITPGDPLLEIVSLTQIEASVDVPERYVGYLEQGVSVPVTIPGLGEAPDRTATLTAIVPSADRLSRLFPVRLAVENPDGLIKPGMSVTASVPTGETRERLTISKDAVLRDDGGEYVYAAVPFTTEGNPAITHQARAVRIDSEFAVGTRVVTRSPRLEPGMPLVVEGNERLFPGQPLIIQNTEALPNDGDAPGETPPAP